MAGRFTMADRYLPDDPREWLNRARSNLTLAKSTCDAPVYFLKTRLLIRNGSAQMIVCDSRIKRQREEHIKVPGLQNHEVVGHKFKEIQ